MGHSKNNWFKYIDRSFEQIMDVALSKLGVSAPEITDHTVNNPYVRELSNLAGIAEMLGFYVDNWGRERLLNQARLFSSVVGMARLHDYQIRGYVPYSVDVVFTINQAHVADIVINPGTRLATPSGRIFTLVTQAKILAGQLVSSVASARQMDAVTVNGLAVSDGLPNQEIVVPYKAVHDSISVSVNGTPWMAVDTFAFSEPTDTHFRQNVNEDGDVVIQFGNANPFGAIPTAGHSISISFNETEGSTGVADAGSITTILSITPSLPVGITATVTNPIPATGGDDVESIESIRKNVPASIRTLRRAVTEDDFKDLAEQVGAVASAGVEFSCGKKANIYIAPVGGGIASTVLLNTVHNYLDIRKVAGVNLNVLSAGIAQLSIKVNVNIKPGYENSVVESELEASLLEFYSASNQDVGGTIVIGDAYEIIENHEAVRNSNITDWFIVPYARPETSGIPVLQWSIPNNGITNSLTSTERWKIVFITSTTFHLIRNGTILGTYNVGSPVSVPGLTFTVAANGYSNGNTYNFVTYPYNSGEITLIEPNIPTLTNYTINVTGGI